MTKNKNNKMSIRLVPFVTAIFFSFSSPTLLLSQAQETAQNDKVVIVLDASGSMWGQINKEAKINIAKGVVKDLVGDLDSGVDLGLTVYGHRKKGDCEDIESLVPVAPVNKNTFKNVVDKISPKGKTPLSKAVIKAAEELKYTEQKATVILVSDGIETCDYDPCEVAAKLEKTGIDFTTHVVGFDINEEEAREQLTCLAENTGGKFMAAADAASLKDSLNEAVKQVVTEKNVQLVAVTEPGGKPLEDVYWEVFAKASDELSKAKRVTYGRGPTPKYTLEPGEYVAKVKSTKGKATAEKAFTVVADTLNKEEVLLAEEGIVKLVAVNEEGGTPLKGVYWNLYEHQEEEGLENAKRVNYGGGDTPEYKLLPGKYLAKVNSTKGKAVAEKVITVTAGKRATEEIVIAKEGILKLVAVNEEGGTPLKGVYWNLYEHQEEEGLENPKRVNYGGGDTPEYKLLPGKYLAKVNSTKGKAVAEKVITVTAGKRATEEVVIAKEGIVKLVAVNEEGGKPLDSVYWSVYEATAEDSLADPKRVNYGGGDTPEYKLLPGKYLAKVKSTQGKATAEQAFEVTAGKQNKVEVVIAQEGVIQLHAVTEKGGKPLSDIVWSMYSIVPEDSLEDPVQVTYGKGATPSYKLLPGKYLAKAKSRLGKAKIEQEVEVVGGKKLTTEVLFPAEGEVQLIAMEQEGGKPLTTGVRWQLLTIVPEDSLETPEVVHYGGGAQPKFRLLPGKYLAKMTMPKQKIEIEKEVEVVAGKRTKHEIVITSEG